MLEKILFPYDGSDNCKGAKEYVTNLAGKFNSKVVILTVCQTPLLIPSQDIPGFIYTDIENELYENAIEITKEILYELKRTDIITELVVGKGYPGQNINEVAIEKNVDLIVMGGRCLNGIKNFLIGSVSNYVLHHTNIPVLVIK